MVMTEREPVLMATNLTKRYADKTVVDGVDLVLHRGEILGLLGPNGAGKTTTLEMIEGLRSADQGDIAIFGQRWSKSRRDIQERIGIQLQSTALLPNLTVTEALQTQAALYRQPAPVATLIDRLGLAAKRKALTSDLSGGQLQRLAIGLALAGTPEIVFLDEPTAGLDPAARRDLWELVRELRTAGAAILLTTHYLEEAEYLCDRIAIMDAGKVVGAGSLSDLIAQAGRLTRIAFPPDPDFGHEELSRLSGVARLNQTAVEVTLSTADLGRTLFDLLALTQPYRGLPAGLTVRQPTLEEVFLEMTGHPLAA